MKTSRTDFKSMFLISESYLNELKNKQSVSETSETTVAPKPSAQTQFHQSLLPPPLPSVSVPTDLEPDSSRAEEEDTNHQKENSEQTSVTNTSKLDDRIEEGQYETIEDKVNSFNCPVCNQGFTSEEDMLVHQARNHPKHECLLCNKTFKSSRELDKHITMRHEYKQRRTSKRLINKTTHKDSDELSNGKKSKTSVTSRKKVKVQFQPNVQNIVGIKDEKIKCDVCGKEFKDLYQYRDHEH